MKKLQRTQGKGAMFLGICGGLGKYFDLDPTIIRIGMAVATFFSMGTLIIVYILGAFIIPKEDINSGT